VSDFAMRAKITKIDTEQHLCFGWLYVCETADGEQVIDHSGEYIEEAELEIATYDYVMSSGLASLLHTTFEGGDGTPLAALCECVVTTREKQKMWGLSDGAMPVGAWVGFKILDQGIWDAIKAGEIEAFSIGGSAMREDDAPLADA
jgi:hypothetical protein